MTNQLGLKSAMSPGPVYSNYETKNENQRYHYSRAVRIGPLIKCAGQGGWNLDGSIPNDANKQISIAFQNVDRAVKSAGGRGWEDVISVRSYHLDIHGQLSSFVDHLKKYLPNHLPIWTCIGVTALGDPEMLVEVEVEAYVTD